MPVVASARAAPRESPIDSAELLNPWFAVVDMARVMTLIRGYMSPIPPPPTTQPAMAINGGRVSSAVMVASRIATITRDEPVTVAVRWLMAWDIRPCSQELADQASAPTVRARPACDAENS